MSDAGRQLGAEQVRDLFHELSERLAARGVQAQLFVVGGAAMALAYDRHRSTRDVDAYFAPAPEVRRTAKEIGDALGLEPDWLNDAVKGFLPGTDEHPRTVFESESLHVEVASPEYLLAMKLHASRGRRDLDDAAILFNRLGYTTAEQAIDLLSRTYPASQLLPRHYYIAEDVAQRAAQRDAALDAGDHDSPAPPVHDRPRTPGPDPAETGPAEADPAETVGAEEDPPEVTSPETDAERLRRSSRRAMPGSQSPGSGRPGLRPPNLGPAEPITPPTSRPSGPPSIGF